MDKESLINELKNKVGSGLKEITESYDLLSFEIDKDQLHDTVLFLKEKCNFIFLTDLCGIHYPDRDLALGVIYHLHNLEQNIRIRLKTFVSAENPSLKSIHDIFSAANWMERETYDFYGINFEGHPNLIRILNVEYLDYFPLRKEYPLEDQTRDDKDDRYFGRDLNIYSGKTKV